jgi:hypothetical protein
MNAFHNEDVALMAYYAGPVKMLSCLRAGEVPDRFRVYPRRVKAVQRRLHRGAGTPVATAGEPAVGARVMAE